MLCSVLIAPRQGEGPGGTSDFWAGYQPGAVALRRYVPAHLGPEGILEDGKRRGLDLEDAPDPGEEVAAPERAGVTEGNLEGKAVR